MLLTNTPNDSKVGGDEEFCPLGQFCAIL